MIWTAVLVLLSGLAYGVFLKISARQIPEADNSITIAVASNFMVPAQVLADGFQQASGVKPLLSFGSTGKHYTQIVNGAPFDVFLAADEEHPQKLVASHHAVPGERFPYAIGRLVLWSKSQRVDESGIDFLKFGDYTKLAIANPRHAPYGLAAREVLEAGGLWDAVQPRLVMGENIGQTHTFIATQNAEVGFVALSQILQPGQEIDGYFWRVPQNLHSEINQQALLLRDKPAARQFLEYLRSEESQRVIQSYGYGVP